MGNKKYNPHQSRGKYQKKKIPSANRAGNCTRHAEANTDTRLYMPIGCRIINLDNLKTFVSETSTHSGVCGGEIVLSGESKDGIASVLTAQCKSCKLEINFPTSSKVAGPTGNNRWECNLSAVWGQMSNGGGHSHLEESMAVLGVPVMTKKTFMRTEKVIGKWWWDEMEASCSLAAAEEKKLAIERGSFFEGVPAITVIVDGGWSKRSHKHSYNAKSGVAIIIGKETGKILYIGVRNKYCSVCIQADRAGKDPQVHECHKNWDGPSASMETDILVEGFKEAESKHGLRYIQFIGDAW